VLREKSSAHHMASAPGRYREERYCIAGILSERVVGPCPKPGEALSTGSQFRFGSMRIANIANGGSRRFS